jgi:hypothetical protein
MTMPQVGNPDAPAPGAQAAQFVVPPGNDPEVKIDGYDGTWTRAKVAAAAAKDPSRDGIPEDNEIAQRNAGRHRPHRPHRPQPLPPSRRRQPRPATRRPARSSA